VGEVPFAAHSKKGDEKDNQKEIGKQQMSREGTSDWMSLGVGEVKRKRAATLGEKS